MDHTPPTRGFALRPLFLFTLVFYLSVGSRLIFSPLLLTIEADVGIDHAEAGSLFLLMSLGYAPMILLSGFVASAIRHSGAILLSMVIVAASLLLISVATTLAALRTGMCFLGVGAGLYVASGLASLMRAVAPEHWGKAIAIHEVAPNIASITAPLIVLLALRFGTWRGLARVIAVLCLTTAALFIILNRSSRFRGATPRFGTLGHYTKERTFWILVLFFSLSSGAALGVYSMLPTYLVAERGMSPGFANAIISVGRAAGLALIFVAGALADRIGFNRIIAFSIGITAIFTVLLGLLPTPLLPIAIIVQPMIAVAFFPAALAALARIGPRESQNVGISLIIPFGIIAGGGLFPLIMGNLGEAGRFYLGFIVLGAVMLVSLVLAPSMRFPSLRASAGEA